MAVQIEDKEFFSHRGVSLKGIARLLLSVMRLGPRSGGSTITQQFARTLFIIDQKKLVRRKLVEILLALWLSKVISKDRVLEMYLASVRFDYGVMGIAAACSRFLKGPRESTIGSAEAFFLIERLSNVRSLLLGPRVAQTLRRAVYDGVLTAEDAVNTVAIYRRVIDQGLIIDQSKYLPKLENEWSATQQTDARDV
ncbi:transglycosylase domain-containing protein [Aliidiomarina sanyensis]|nr:transglycosylase domain-containing protein [Aliidiomarina sanyensis]